MNEAGLENVGSGHLIHPLAPAGSLLRADRDLRTIDDQRVLVGGSPLRIVRLSETGASVVARWLAGEPVSADQAHRRLARRLLDAGLVHPDPARRAPEPITVVVPVKNDSAGLDRCLGGLESVSVVVVDDGSIDATAVSGVAGHHGATVIRRETSGGPGLARTVGAGVASTELIAFVDADVETPMGWLDQLSAHFDDPGVVAVAPRVRSRRGRSLRSRYERHHSPLDLGTRPANVGPGRAVAYVPTAALLIRRSALTAVGGFDPGLRFGEDVDLIWRLVEAGGTVRYDPAVEVAHEPRGSWRAWFQQRRSYGSSAAALGRRHGRLVAPARASRSSLAAWCAVACGHPVVGISVGVVSSIALADRLQNLATPRREAARLAAVGHLRAGLGLAESVRRAWWPIAMLVGWRRSRSRRWIAALFVVPAAADWVGGRRPTDPIRTVGLRILDDVAYGVGLWEGMIRERTLRPIVPDLVGGPDSKADFDPATVPAR